MIFAFAIRRIARGGRRFVRFFYFLFEVVILKWKNDVFCASGWKRENVEKPKDIVGTKRVQNRTLWIIHRSLFHLYIQGADNFEARGAGCDGVLGDIYRGEGVWKCFSWYIFFWIYHFFFYRWIFFSIFQFSENSWKWILWIIQRSHFSYISKMLIISKRERQVAIGFLGDIYRGRGGMKLF